AGSSCKSTAVECPWLARMSVPVSSKEKRCLGLVRITSSSSAGVIGKPCLVAAARRSSIATHPPGRRVRPRASGSWRRCLDRNLLTVVLRLSFMSNTTVVERLRFAVASKKHQPPALAIHFDDRARLSFSVPLQNRLHRLHDGNAVSIR